MVEEGSGTVLSVQATAYDATENEAAKFFSYVAKLSLEDTNSINIEAWVNSNISSGGQYLANGAQLKLYGTEQARTLEIVASSSP